MTCALVSTRSTAASTSGRMRASWAFRSTMGTARGSLNGALLLNCDRGHSRAGAPSEPNPSAQELPEGGLEARSQEVGGRGREGRAVGEAAGNADRVHGSGARHLHVLGTVAHVGGLGGTEAEAMEGENERLRVGLAPRGVPPADHRLEEAGHPERFELLPHPPPGAARDYPLP